MPLKKIFLASIIYFCYSIPLPAEIYKDSITIGGNYDYAPYDFINEKGNPAGYAVDLDRALAKTLDLKISIKLRPWVKTREALENGEIDIIHGMFYSKERDKYFDFSPPHTIIVNTVFAKKGTSVIRSLKEMSGKRVAVVRKGVIHETLLELGFENNLISKKSEGAALRYLAAGKCDYAVLAKLPGLFLVNKLQLSNIVVAGPVIHPSKYCYAVKEGNKELLNLINEGLAILKNTGEYKRIYNKWLGVLDPPGISKRNVSIIIILIVFPLILILLGAIIWSRILKRKVNARTLELQNEIIFRKKTEKEKAKMESHLRQTHKMEAIGTLAGGIAHDFNNILSIILGGTELAMKNIPQESKAYSHLEKTKIAAIRGTELIHQLMNFSRKKEQEFIPLNLTHAIKEISVLLRSTLPSSIEIKTELADGELFINADPIQIHQVFLNLCTNASHAIKGNKGVITITTGERMLSKNEREKYTEFSSPEVIEITVKDNGAGIASNDLNHIFEPYFTTKDIGKGTGMGLAVVHGIIKRHGGIITARSKIGRGSTFIILLPSHAGVLSKYPGEVENGYTATISGNESILFVDDEPFIVDIAIDTLKKFGYTVTGMSDSVKALELFRQKPENYDLIITDMTMPHMTGDQLSKEIKKIRHDVPVILCTGFSERIDKDIINDDIIDKLVEKPVKGEDLPRLVRQILDKKE